MSDVTYIDAIHAALEKALESDPEVFLYGQDIGKFGGAFKATKGLFDKFPDRVLDAPISEDAMAGIAVGAAIVARYEPTPSEERIVKNGAT